MTRLRRHAARGALTVAASIAIVGAVHASAPPGQYATFGRTDRCISDVLTKLTWLRAPLTNELSFGDGGMACAGLGAGWRVPSVNELLTLVDESPHYEVEGGRLVPKAIDANAFPATPVGSGYWTSSAIPGQGKAWAVNFQDGSTFGPAQSEQHEVRCVIVTPPSSTPTACQ